MLGQSDGLGGRQRLVCGRCCSLGEFETSPDVHVDDHRGDLGDLLLVEVDAKLIVQLSEMRDVVQGEALAVRERDLLGVREHGTLTPTREMGDHLRRDPQSVRHLGVQDEAVRARVELGHPKAQELGKTRIQRQLGRVAELRRHLLRDVVEWSEVGIESSVLEPNRRPASLPVSVHRPCP